MRAVLDAISLWAIPVLLVGIPLVGLLRKVKVYDIFIDGTAVPSAAHLRRSPNSLTAPVSTTH